MEENNIKLETIGKDVTKYIRKTKKLAFSLDEDDADDVEVLTTLVKGAVEGIGVSLGKAKDKDTVTNIAIDDLITISVSWREGEDEASGNWGIGITAGEGLKKLIKNDEDTEE